jgi:hypothetical protein
MIRLLIKGDLDTAHRATVNRGMETISSWKLHRDCTIGYTRDEYWREVMNWFGEPGQAPFPPGSLLHFALDQKEDS